MLDVRDEKAVAGYMDYVAARGQVDYLFCNAGVGFRQPYCDITKREDWNTCIPQPIGIEQAGDEILDGIRNGDQVIPLNDDARRLYQAIREGRPEYVEEAIRIVKARALEGMETTAAAPAVGT